MYTGLTKLKRLVTSSLPMLRSKDFLSHTLDAIDLWKNASLKHYLLRYELALQTHTQINYYNYTYTQVDDISSIASPVEVKIMGDGAPFSRSSSYILLSFSFPSLGEKLSSEGIVA